MFVIGQNVPEDIEMDEFDQEATHVLAYWNEISAGTARWRITNEGTKLERFAVLDEYRNKGIGKALVEYILKEVRGSEKIYLNAQEFVIKFYEKHNFVSVGKRFLEAGIPHKQMVYKLKT